MESNENFSNGSQPEAQSLFNVRKNSKLIIISVIIIVILMITILFYAIFSDKKQKEKDIAEEIKKEAINETLENISQPEAQSATTVNVSFNNTTSISQTAPPNQPAPLPPPTQDSSPPPNQPAPLPPPTLPIP